MKVRNAWSRLDHEQTLSKEYRQSLRITVRQINAEDDAYSDCRTPFELPEFARFQDPIRRLGRISRNSKARCLGSSPYFF